MDQYLKTTIHGYGATKAVLGTPIGPYKLRIWYLFLDLPKRWDGEVLTDSQMERAECCDSELEVELGTLTRTKEVSTTPGPSWRTSSLQRRNAEYAFTAQALRGLHRLPFHGGFITYLSGLDLDKTQNQYTDKLHRKVAGPNKTTRASQKQKAFLDESGLISEENLGKSQGIVPVLSSHAFVSTEMAGGTLEIVGYYLGGATDNLCHEASTSIRPADCEVYFQTMLKTWSVSSVRLLGFEGGVSATVHSLLDEETLQDHCLLLVGLLGLVELSSTPAGGEGDEDCFVGPCHEVQEQIISFPSTPSASTSDLGIDSGVSVDEEILSHRGEASMLMSQSVERTEMDETGVERASNVFDGEFDQTRSEDCVTFVFEVKVTMPAKALVLGVIPTINIEINSKI